MAEGRLRGGAGTLRGPGMSHRVYLTREAPNGSETGVVGMVGRGK